MRHESNNYTWPQVLLLIWRYPARACWQLLPAFFAGLILTRIAAILSETGHPPYIGAFLVIVISLLALATLVIYYRESRLELDGLHYLFVAGYPRGALAAIILIKWLLLTAAGLLLSLVIQLLTGHPAEPLILGALYLFFAVVLGAAITSHILRQWKIN
jgi:hypothetical protein